MTIPTALAGRHAVVPLPFAPGSLNGLSERMVTSHHENNHGGAVRNLNRAEQELSRIAADNAARGRGDARARAALTEAGG